MDVLVTGSTGLIGTALRRRLATEGHRVVQLVRREARGPDEVRWSVEDGSIDAAGLEGIDGVVHLAGAPIGGRRWNEGYKAKILESRDRGTTLLAETLAGLSSKPRVLVSASAVGYYGADRGDEVLTEASAPGDDFIARVCQRWEASTAPSEEAGIRVARIRSGLVLSSEGGLMKKLLLPFRLGLGGRIGSGDAWWSWIAIDDEVSAILRLLEDDALSGSFNLTAPEPVRNAGFTDALGDVLGRPTVIPVPAPALKVALGAEMAEGTVLASQRVVPEKLQGAGFTFRFTDVRDALRHVLGR